ncbi:MAG: B12-binding domain-containing radical SAM protein [Desulfomonile sp.]|nr:B12-binding domain-containing radical SAM protein [Desulfomonile sp.]
MKTYPLNILGLATYVRDRAGHDAAVIDGESISIPGLEPEGDPNRDPEQVMNAGIPRMVGILEDPDHPLWQEMERLITDQSPDLVGISCNSGNLDTVRRIVDRVKRYRVPVILGGSHPTVLPEQTLTYTGADLAAVGEGELTLAAVMDALDGRRGSVGEIPSLALRGNGMVTVRSRGKLIADLDSLPIPDRSFVRRDDYFGEVLLTGRGCPFNCSYCASRNIWGRKVRLRSTASIIEELELLAEGAENEPEPRPGRWVVKIVDDTFTVSRRRTLELLDRIIDRKLNRFEFTGGVRADTLDEELVRRMREANFRRVTLGVESGSPRILAKIRKGETNEDVKRAVALLRAAGIHSHAFFMIGLPGETPEDIELSKKLINEAQPDHVEINMVTPYPGTDIFSELIPEDPLKIDRWYRWFHQGMSTHSDQLGYDLDKEYHNFLEFARNYHASRAKTSAIPS